MHAQVPDTMASSCTTVTLTVAEQALALAQSNEAAVASANASMDSMWLILGGAMVFFMHSGFALLEVGSVSVRNTQNILLKNILSPTISAFLFWVFGYALAYGEPGNGFAGSLDATVFTQASGVDTAVSMSCEPATACESWETSSCPADATSECECSKGGSDCVFTETADGYNGHFYAGWFFQWAFCATASTIVSGAVAERILFKVYVIITVFLTGFIYPIVAHWGWGGNGWASAWCGNIADCALFGVGTIDFAGSGVVHMTGGVAALIAAVFIGPRHGRFVKHFQLDGHWYAKTVDQPLVQPTGDKWMEIILDDASPSGETWQTVTSAVEADLNKLENTLPSRWKSNPFPASSSTFQTFGCLILWFGWYGFNCVSTLAISSELSGVAAKVAATTTCGAAGGALSAFAIVYMLDGIQDLGAISNGILAGLVSITSACPVVEPWAAFVIGIIGGGIYVAACELMEKLRIDDVVLAIPVHCFCGMWGVLSAGIFATQKNYAAAYSTPENPESCVLDEAAQCEAADGGTWAMADCSFTPGDESSCNATKCMYTAPVELAADGGVPCGILYGCDKAGSQLMAQVVFIVAVFAWVAGTMTVLMLVTKLILGAITGFEKSPEHSTPLAYCKGAQMKGMDMMKHGGMASPETMTRFSGKSGIELWDGVPSSPGKTVVKQAFPASTPGKAGKPGTFQTWFSAVPAMNLEASGP